MGTVGDGNRFLAYGQHARPIPHNDLVPKTSRSHPVMLPDDCIRKRQGMRNQNAI